MAETELGAFGKKRLKAKLRFFKKSKKYANLSKEEKTKIALAMIRKEDADLAQGRKDARQADIDKAKAETGVDLGASKPKEKPSNNKPKTKSSNDKPIKEIVIMGKKPKPKAKGKVKLKRTMSGFKPIREKTSTVSKAKAKAPEVKDDPKDIFGTPKSKRDAVKAKRLEEIMEKRKKKKEKDNKEKPKKKKFTVGRR